MIDNHTRVGRGWYAIGYMQEPKKRGPGFGVSFLALAVLMFGTLIGFVIRMF